jgi:putative peptidoglycan lipid II flippase
LTPDPDPTPDAGERTGRAAALIAALTVASRTAGFARVLVFVAAVGNTDLGDMYQTANTIPNIIFEIVAGGALASLVVPLVAGAVARTDRAAAGATTSALLTWVLALLVPVALAVALVAEPVVRLLAPHASDRALGIGVDMLRVFAPQLPLYGVGIVLTGVLQAYRRFAWPVLAPLLSSLAVIVAYGTFALVAGGQTDAAHVGRSGVLVLSIGTTLGVAVLSLCLLIPLRRLRLPIRPRYRFGSAAAAVRRLALAGAVTVGAQQLSLALAIALANGGPDGSVVLYGLAQTIYLLPWAVLALPIATSAYPSLAAAAAAGNVNGYRRTLAPAARGLVYLACLGAAVLAAAAGPIARILGPLLVGGQSTGALRAGVAGFAPGLLGYALFALLTRALYATGDTWLAARATVAGWGAVALASLVFARALPTSDRVAALALANSAGMLLLGAILGWLVGRRTGGLSGLPRAVVAGVLAGAAGTGAGLGVLWLGWDGRTAGFGGALAQGVLAGAVVGVVFLAVVAVLDRRALRPLAGLPARAGTIRRLLRPARRTSGETGVRGRADQQPPGELREERCGDPQR